MAPHQMLMKLAWDDEWLYLAVEVEEPAMDKVLVTAHGRDAYVFNDDSIEWFLDPWQNQVIYYQFGLNLAGAMWDSQVFEPAWDCEWRAAVRASEASWFAECAMPLKPLGKRAVGRGDIWGFNLCRERQAGGFRELINWANVMGNFHRPELFGHLLFLDSLDQLDEARIIAVARSLGGHARFFTEKGWWQVNGAPVHVTYQEDLRRAVSVRLRQLLAQVRQGIDRNQQPELWTRYRQLSEKWYEARRMGEECIGPAQWAHARPALDELEVAVPELLWEVKLSELLRSL
jgi:hypothetical protein